MTRKSLRKRKGRKDPPAHPPSQGSDSDKESRPPSPTSSDSEAPPRVAPVSGSPPPLLESAKPGRDDLHAPSLSESSALPSEPPPPSRPPPPDGPGDPRVSTLEATVATLAEQVGDRLDRLESILLTTRQPRDPPPRAEQRYLQKPHPPNGLDLQPHPSAPPFPQSGPLHLAEPDPLDPIGPPDRSSPPRSDADDVDRFLGSGPAVRPSQVEESLDRSERPVFDSEPPRSPLQPAVPLEGQLFTDSSTQDLLIRELLFQLSQERSARRSAEPPDQVPAGSVAEASERFFRQKQEPWTVSLAQLQGARTFGDLWVGLPILKSEYVEDLLPIQLPESIATQIFEDVCDGLAHSDTPMGDTNWAGVPLDISRLFFLRFLGELLPFVFEARRDYATLRAHWSCLSLLWITDPAPLASFVLELKTLSHFASALATRGPSLSSLGDRKTRCGRCQLWGLAAACPSGRCPSRSPGTEPRGGRLAGCLQAPG